MSKFKQKEANEQFIISNEAQEPAIPVDCMVSLALLPCPFCGETEFDLCGGVDDDGSATAIYCRTCPAGVEHSERTHNELASEWNRRSATRITPKQLSELVNSCTYEVRNSMCTKTDWDEAADKINKLLLKG